MSSLTNPLEGQSDTQWNAYMELEAVQSVTSFGHYDDSYFFRYVAIENLKAIHDGGSDHLLVKITHMGVVVDAYCTNIA